MAAKMTCVGCNARTSAVLRAWMSEEPCPYCGLSAITTAAVYKARAEKVSEDFIQIYLTAEKQAVALSHRLNKAEKTLRSILDILTLMEEHNSV